MTITPDLLTRFWCKVCKDGPDCCWLWLGAKCPKGYGWIHLYKKKGIKAHRLAWQIAYGPIPSELFVCHRCDNPSCVNPIHLFITTNKGNMEDMVRKGRRNHIRGRDHPLAKLNETKVRAARLAYDNGRMNCYELADKYHVNTGTMWDILHHKSWSWIEKEEGNK